MTYQTVTLKLPEPVYRRIQRAAMRAHRPVNEILVEAVTAAVPTVDEEGQQVRPALAQLAYLNDAALWQAARSTMPTHARERLAALHDAQAHRPLAPAERTEEQALLQLYRETILVRAQATVLLQQRGYDVADPDQFTPLA